MATLDQALSLERTAQALADAIGGAGRIPWALAVESPEGLRLYTSENPERARALLKRASEQHS